LLQSRQAHSRLDASLTAVRALSQHAAEVSGRNDDRLLVSTLQEFSVANKFLARFALCISFTTAALAATSISSFAAQGSGTVVTYHLNVAIAGRGACIRTNPPLPGNGWACVYDTQQLYDELNALLSAAYINGKTCTIVTSGTDPFGNGVIGIAECD
jgi:hypothetical protein